LFDLNRRTPNKEPQNIEVGSLTFFYTSAVRHSLFDIRHLKDKTKGKLQ